MQKMIADHAGHYSRPDVFDFRVNATPKRIATFTGRDGVDGDPVSTISAGVRDGGIRNEAELRDALAHAGLEAVSTGGYR